VTIVRIKSQHLFEKALKRFKRECTRDGLLSDMKKKQFYEKPSTRRRRKANRAKRRRLRQGLGD
jgi:small subunit ribosomal protein S21